MTIDDINFLLSRRRQSSCVINNFVSSSEELAPASVSKDEAPKQQRGPSWFETALMRLLTMRNY
jgi:hypothetical protein